MKTRIQILRNIFILVTVLWFLGFNAADIYAGTSDLAWNFDYSAAGWQKGEGISSFTAGEKKLLIKSSSNFPYFISPALNLNSQDYTTLYLRMQSDQDGSGNIFWTTNVDPRFNQYKSISFALGRKGRFNNYYLHIPSQNKYWEYLIRNILINPLNKAGNIEIEEIRLVKGNLYTFIASGIQEFFGPKGREVIGSTINVIQSSTLWGISINIYGYGLVVLGFLGAAIYLTAKHRKNSYLTNLSQALFYSILLTIGLWALLEINSLYSQYNALKKDISEYGGKTLIEKQAASTGKDLFNFIQIAKNTLPYASRIKLDWGENLAFLDLKGRYYLYPLELLDKADKENPLYILIYQNGYSSFLMDPAYQPIYKANNSFILKRKDLPR